MKIIVSLIVLALLCTSALGSDTVQVGKSGFSFKKIFFVLLENQPLHIAMDDPAMSALATKGTLLTNLDAIVNPSQPNYIALVAGDTLGVKGDDPVNLEGRFLIDLFEENGVSWKAYQENYPAAPGECFTGDTKDGLYKRKHNPFMSFGQVRENQTLCSKIVHSDQLWQDIRSGSLPQYSFYTPNMDNNGHDTGMRYAAAWLESFIYPLLAEPKFMEDMLVVITFDEGVKGDNVIYTVMIGNDIPTDSIDTTHYSLFSLLKLVQDQYSLPSLERNDQTATAIHPDNAHKGQYKNMYRIKRIVIGVGASLGLVCAAALAFVIYRRRQRQLGGYSRNPVTNKLKSSDYEVTQPNYA